MIRPGRKKALAIIFVAVLVALSTKALEGHATPVLRKNGVSVLYGEGLMVSAEQVTKIYPKVKEELEAFFGWPLDFQPTVLLTKEKETFQRVAGSELIIAFAVPEKHAIVIDYSKTNRDPFAIDRTLKHELCHLLLYRYIGDENLPKWLDEGIAQWVSGGISEILQEQGEPFLERAVLTERTMGMRALTRRFPRDRNGLLLAYEESKSLVEYMIEQFGRAAFLSILNHLRQGEKPEEAVYKGLSISQDELEKGWLHAVKRRVTWFAYMTHHLYEIVFFIAALAMILAFIRAFAKKRAYLRQTDEDDFGP